MCCTILDICTAHSGGYPLSLVAGNTGGWGWWWARKPCTLRSPTFLPSSKKKGKQKKKKKFIKKFIKFIKSLSPRSKCYCFSHSKASKIQNFFLSANHGGRKYFTVIHGPTTLKPISTALSLLSLIVSALHIMD